MAFPPDASTSGRVFVNFTDTNGDTVVARFVRTAANPLVAVANSRFDLKWSTGERVIRQPFANHNGGNLVFGPDGYLYIGLGDGGSGNDPQNNGQNPAALLGKMLRIDVGVSDSDENGFRVPADNPFLDGIPVAALPEIWSFGWRNPWRYSFDDFGVGATGALIVGDVGQNAREEIDRLPAGSGGGQNFGWDRLEGTLPFEGEEPPDAVPPVFDYGRERGGTVIGGFVYRGRRIPALVGAYVFGDLFNSDLRTLRMERGEARESGLGVAVENLVSFGEDVAGELYAISLSGPIYRIVRS